MNAIEKDWLDYSKDTFAPTMDPQSLAVCRQVFYAGAMAAVGIMDDAPTKSDACAVIVAAMEEHIAEFPAGPETCTKPPEGWRCTRPKGHEGPCSAVPIL